MLKRIIKYLKLFGYVALLQLPVSPVSFADDQKINAGSGFYINKNGDVLTSKHVIDQCDNKSLLFVDYKQKTHQSKVIAVSKEYDLALINTGEKTNTFGSIATSEDAYPVMIDDSDVEFFNFGCQIGKNLQEWASSLSILDSNYNKYPYIGSANLLSGYGCSGSLVMDRSALVIGIVTTTFGKKNDKKIMVYHNLNAIVDFSQKNNIEINHYPRKEFHDPGFVLNHGNKISGQITCSSKQDEHRQNLAEEEEHHNQKEILRKNYEDEQLKKQKEKEKKEQLFNM